MRVPDVLLESVVFLALARSENDTTSGGTAILIGVPFEGNAAGDGQGYLVTAKHNVEAAGRSPDAFVARVNTDLGSQILGLPKSIDAWLTPEDEACDVACLRVPFGPVEDTLLAPWPAKWILTASEADNFRVGAGDDLVIMGLFSLHAGGDRNVPVLRTGCVAAMRPGLMIDQRSGKPFDGHLIEVRSIGGLSGSPVLVQLQPGRLYSSLERVEFRLLGLVRGHWEQFGPPRFPDTEQQTYNTGITIVTPAQHIRDLIFSATEVQFRRELAQSITKTGRQQ